MNKEKMINEIVTESEKKVNALKIFLWILSLISLIFVYVGGCCDWYRKTYVFEDADFEWDDEGDRYEIYVEDLEQHHFYIPTKKATLIWLPGDELLNFAVIKEYKTLFWQKTEYKLTDFYLNIGWVEEE